ncbi:MULTISPECIES: HK97 family phage prohead protease [Priestia]|uniref:Peptidase U35 n=2 Tax=Priestia TaxID=2800373 RepID=A0A0V8JRU7_9BACI|nr:MULTISPECIES: HK97 family phage prohead protease [Priestia]KSU89817.1 peptidase U35 [Priestia veravalensis]MBN8249962.1 HK97 family phage prohead protease [Priestia flexa]MBN8434715.1 HK97 family phage prohead protease [Priestia flexa]MCA0967254.1 HK97 family phage prohead protease [Priestia flexa]MEC0664489.1 HK97 family phage prohead protease [Priestia flexa]
MNKTEKRNINASSIEIREDESDSKIITGYAVKWEMKSHPMGYFRRFKEQFRKGAFADSLTADDQLALWSHDTSRVLGRTKNGTLRLFEDDIGLRFELDLPNTTLGNDTLETIRRGDVEGVSFGFQMRKEEWDETDRDNIIRTITTAKLIEISPVAFPAYPDSQVSARSNDPYQSFIKERQQKSLRKKLLLKTYL